jgi:branched-chain amino acid transport system substrate-binding protein
MFPISNLKSLLAGLSRFQISNPESFFAGLLRFQISNLKSLFAGLLQFQISNFKSFPAGLPLIGLLFPTLFAWTLHGFAQAPPAPYAVIPHDAVNYSGPGRDAGHDLEGSEIKIGFILPLGGPHLDEGQGLLQAAQLALEDEAASPLPEGRRISLVPRDQNGLWGRTSSEVVHLVYEDQAVAIVTALDGGSAHIAEQVANKVGIPVVTLSTDPTTTQINLPWIFRLGPTDTQQARAFARDIYVARKLEQVVLIVENGHDGRVGGGEFQKAARQLNAPPLLQLPIDPADWSPGALIRQIIARRPQALVFWTGHETAAKLVPPLSKAFPMAPIYLCQEASQGRFDPGSTNIWVAAPGLEEHALRESFEKRYRARAGVSPAPAAAQAYDAVRLLAAALRRSGPNRARLRDALADLPRFSGASGVISFDHAGNDLSAVTLVRLP